MARRRPGEEKIREIRTRNQKHAADRTEQRVKDGLYIADSVVLKRHHEDAPTFLRIGILHGELGGDDI